MADNNKNKNEDGEKTVLLDEDNKTVLLDEEGSKTELIDEENKTVLLDEDKVTEATEKLRAEADRRSSQDKGITETGGTVKIADTERCLGCMEKIPAGSRFCPNCGFDRSNYEAKIHHLPPGSILYDRYVIGRVIGEGGFGITYMGFDKKLDIRVAIKEYFPSGMVMRDTTGARGNTVTAYNGRNRELYEKYLSRFYNEAKTLAKLQNIEGVVRVQDYFSENDTAYIIMEYVDGRDLKQYAKEKNGKLSVEESLELFYPVAQALSRLHKNGVIHRDISPDNIMVTKEGKVILIDLGASREFGDSQKSMSVLLKPGYAPIEQYQSAEKQGVYTDIYSFCASFYRMITGKTPTDAMERLAADTLKRPSELGIKIDPNVENALMKGLSVHHSDRFQNIDELIDVFYKGKSMGQDTPRFKSPEQKSGASAAKTENTHDIDDVSSGAEAAGAGGSKKNKLPIIIISGAVLAGIVTFLIIFLNMANNNKVIIVDENGNTIEVDPDQVAGGDESQSSEEGTDNDSSDATPDRSNYKKIDVAPIAQKSAQTGPAEILHDSGAISRSGQTDYFEFVTPREGRYRVEVSNMPSNMSVDLGFYDPKGEAVGEEKGCRNGQGVTVKYLKANTTYKIYITQNSGTGSYNLDVGVQKPTPDITQLTRIDDSVEYTDQRNLYNFDVPKDGTYRFELSDLGSGATTSMWIFDGPGQKISQDDNCLNGEGLTLADVKAGTNYEIQVRQNSGYSGYSLNIGQQKDRVDIANRTIVTDSIEFTDQTNIYSFNASSSGKVKFSLSDMPSDMAVEMIITDSNGNVIASEANCRNDGGISINDVASGSHYNIKIVQSAGKGNYTFTAD